MITVDKELCLVISACFGGPEMPVTLKSLAWRRFRIPYITDYAVTIITEEEKTPAFGIKSGSLNIIPVSLVHAVVYRVFKRGVECKRYEQEP